MSEIKVKCPDCGKEIKINIKTIDSLKSQLEAMTKDRDYYKVKLAALEGMNKSKPNDYGDLFNKMFGGMK